jgi:DNA transformation protein and related proteins
MADDLEQLPNLGPKLSAGLHEVGVDSYEELADLGAIEAWERLRAAGLFDCCSSLFALEGAIQGVRWHHLPDERRAELTAHVRSVGR